MKKALSLILVATVLITGLCGCKKESKPTKSKKPTEVEVHDSDDPEVEEHNRKILSEALWWDEDDEYLKYQISALKKCNAGMIQSARYHEEDDLGRCLTVIGEDGTEFLILLNSGDFVDAVQNVTTGEWVVRSYR